MHVPLISLRYGVFSGKRSELTEILLPPNDCLQHLANQDCSLLFLHLSWDPLWLESRIYCDTWSC